MRERKNSLKKSRTLNQFAEVEHANCYGDGMATSTDGTSARVIDGEEDDTIELELSESAMQALSQAAAVEQPSPSLTPAAIEQHAPTLEQDVRTPKRDARASERESIFQARAPQKSRLRVAVVLGIVAAVSVLLGGVAYMTTTRVPPPIQVAANSVSLPVASEAPAPASPPPARDVPVRFKNPFDRTEVFEFPPGTSKSEARAAVAELLSKRAQERQSLFVKMPRRNSKTADRDTSVTASRQAPRS
jgi:hypothetical protein